MRKYTLLLVDDEEEVRKGILQKINWQEYGFDTIVAAENGKEALEIAEKALTDVLITDIKMPFMDGIQLAEAIRIKLPMTKIIVLTGFDEFEYAQKAIKLNVVEYVLKPISAKELTEVLFKVKKQIDEEINEKENIELLRENYIRSIPILKEKFLTSLVTSNLEKEEIEEKAANYNVKIKGSSFVVSIVRINNYFLEAYDAKELTKFAVLNIIEETVNKYELGNSFINNENIVIITVSNGRERDGVIKYTFSALEEIRQAVERFLKVTITVGVGSICSEITSVNHSYENALAALDYKIIMESNRIIWIEDIEPKSVDRIVFDEAKEHVLVSAIKVGTEKEIEAAIKLLFQGITDFNATIKDYQIYLIEILTTILKSARNSNIDMDDIFGESHNLYIELNKLSSKVEVERWFKEISLRTMNFIARSRQDNCKLIVGQAKEFVKQNYKNCDMSINGVCDYLHISPTYFSYVFKKETKTTFINYLTQIRMEAAKDLLRTTNLKAFEIADRVGYSEPNYFSYSFKKKFQLSPSEYRNSFS